MAKLLQMAGTALLPFPEVDVSPAPADVSARQQALDIHRSWIVEAPAGSGKTGLLMQRLLKLLARADLRRPSEVLAITFTRKAAAELRARVLDQLTAAANAVTLAPTASAFDQQTRLLAQEVLERDRTAGWHLLESPSGLNVRTIDSFCAELAGSLPLSARSDGRQTPTEDPAPLYREAAERVLSHLGGRNTALDQALRCVLLHRDAQIADCMHLIAGMLGEREQWAEFLPLHKTEWDDALLDREIRARLEATLHGVITRALHEVHQALDPTLLGDLTRFAASLQSLHGASITYPPTPDPADQPHWEQLVHLLLTQEGLWRTRLDKRVLGMTPDARQRADFTDLITRCRAQEQHLPHLSALLHSVRQLPPHRYPEDQWRVVKALFHVLRYALVELRQVFAEHGACDFTEVALTARTLLAGDCAHAPCLQLEHLLVDEMQDTSAGQYDLLEQLTRHWDGYTQTVFLVGDPKQSIYLFRQARVERFLSTQSTGRLGDVALSSLRLTANFRSQAALVKSFNETFAQIFPAPEGDAAHHAPGDVPFVAAAPIRAAGRQPALSWHLDVQERAASRPQPDEDDDSLADVLSPEAGAQARHIRRTIEDFRQRWSHREPSGRPPRIAVLARTRAHLAPILAEFQRDDGDGPLPFRAVKVEHLEDRPEVLDLVALTRALLHPADRVAWLALLRSPVCGLSTVDLLTLTGEGTEASPNATVAHLVQTRAHLLSPGGQDLLARSWPHLVTALRTVGQTTFSTHVTRTWHSLGADVFLSAQQQSNANRFLALLSKLETGVGGISLTELTGRLSDLYAEPSVEEDAVELMTIHNAKGLEWDLVLLPSLEGQARRDEAQLLQWLELDDHAGRGAEVLLAPIQSKGYDASRLSRWLARAKTQRQATEAKRLFYVACTRAREELHLYAACDRKANGEIARPDPTSLLSAAWPAAERVLEHLSAEQEQEQRAPNVVRLPPRIAPATPPQSVALAAAAAPTTPGVQRRVARLPSGFDPVARLQAGALPMQPWSAPPPAARVNSLNRPEGSFEARAFGNVVHRFLELLAKRLRGGDSPDRLLAELPSWQARLHTSLRGEGLSPGLATRNADRARSALGRVLTDPVGTWALAPHEAAGTEVALELAQPGRLTRQLRADRVFLAGPEPLASTGPRHLWIVDYKTTDPGGFSLDEFLAQGRAQYAPQLNLYAEAVSQTLSEPLPVKLALFYPLIPQMLHWRWEPSPHPR